MSAASKSAVEAVEKLGGVVISSYYNKLSLRALKRPQDFDVIPRRARPPRKLMAHYGSWEKRGYLSSEMQLLMQERGIKLPMADAAGYVPQGGSPPPQWATEEDDERARAVA